MHEMDDDNHIKSDNSDTQRLSINDNTRVVSTVSPRDMTVTQLLHNKPTTDELAANLALAKRELIHFALLTLQRHCHSLLTKR